MTVENYITLIFAFIGYLITVLVSLLLQHSFVLVFKRGLIALILICIVTRLMLVFLSRYMENNNSQNSENGPDNNSDVNRKNNNKTIDDIPNKVNNEENNTDNNKQFSPMNPTVLEVEENTD